MSFSVNYGMEVKLEEWNRDVTNATFRSEVRRTSLSIPTGDFPGC